MNPERTSGAYDAPVADLRNASMFDFADVQGNIVQAYALPFARYMFFGIEDGDKARAFLKALVPHITTAVRWEGGLKPDTTVNVALTYLALKDLGVPASSLASFPVDFREGMLARGHQLGDEGTSGPDHWDEVWRDPATVKVIVTVNSKSRDHADAKKAEVERIVAETGGVVQVGEQDGEAIKIDGAYTAKEHFAFTDGIGNPQFEVPGLKNIPGRGKLTEEGQWAPLARGEFLLGWPDEAGELPPAPNPPLLGRNGTFMVWRKLHQNVQMFRDYIEAEAAVYGDKERLLAKICGRWRDGTPIERSPTAMNPALAEDPLRNNDFRYRDDLDGSRCPVGAHIRRANPRDALGFDGDLVNRRRIMRRGITYGDFVPEGTPADDAEDRGIVFISLSASISRQFEFVQRMWMNYGNPFKQGNDKDILIGDHDGTGQAVITSDSTNRMQICFDLPRFVEVRGGTYLFMPSLTALRLIADGAVRAL